MKMNIIVDLGSNGLTSARHDVLAKYYAEQYPETFEPALSDAVVYIGKNKMTETIICTGVSVICKWGNYC